MGAGGVAHMGAASLSEWSGVRQARPVARSRGSLVRWICVSLHSPTESGCDQVALPSADGVLGAGWGRPVPPRWIDRRGLRVDRVLGVLAVPVRPGVDAAARPAPLLLHVA